MTQATVNLSKAAAAATARGRPLSSPRFGLFLLLVMAVASVFTAALLLGSVAVPFADILRALVGQPTSNPAFSTIVVDFRLPRVLTALFGGAALAVSGLHMQTLFRNPLADPFVLGISSGASLGAALVVLFSGGAGGVMLAGLGLLGDFALTFGASLGAALVMLLTLLVARRIGNTLVLLVVGVMVGYGVGSLVSVLLYFSIPERVKAYTNWTFGSFNGVTWGQMPIFMVVIAIGLAGSFALAKTLNGFLLGETYAQSMGFQVRQARMAIIAVTALLAGAVTAFCGPIGFLGIAAPHLARALFKTADHRFLLPTCALLGSVLAMLADIIAQWPGNDATLPLNAVMALFGAPLVLAALLRRS
jgi:iron complex transport system permease protein